ncbi:MAG TPA: PH domain-containing protein [Rhodanobacteraceae bacterium]|nr:PH domain-containing protein [Rhodanobacteraceae bacterium]
MSKKSRTLPLAKLPRSAVAWLFVLALGVPVAIAAFVLGSAYREGAPAAPLLSSGIFVLVVSMAVTLWIVRMTRRIAVTLDDDALTVGAGIATKRFALATLCANGVRTVDLAAHPELKPRLRTWGIGLPGLASGWFRLRNGGKALCVLKGNERVTVLRSDDGTWVLLSLEDASALRSAIGPG